MLLSEFIAQARQKLKEHGDLPVVMSESFMEPKITLTRDIRSKEVIRFRISSSKTRGV